jgi:peptidoglycan/LPS O-acetylase OafA/YrhL
MSAPSIPISVEVAPSSACEPFVLGHRPALDGVRGIAILAVLAVHTNHLLGWSLLQGGSIGVDIFFVLSGFLITSILLDEWNKTGSIKLGRFYLRRFLRLVPALLLLVATVHLAANFLYSPQEAANTRRAAPLALFYVTDFAIVSFPNIQLGALRHTWSLAMEEQFYLVWPPILILLLKIGSSKKQLILLTVLLALASAVHRAALYQYGSSVVRTYYGVDARADSLLIGCAMGMAVTWGLLGSMHRVTAPALFLLGVVIIASDYDTPFMHQAGFTIVAAATALIILNLVSTETRFLRRILESATLVWIGRISYGVYLWHYAVFKWVKYLSAPWPVKLILALLTTFLVASLSFYLLESPLLRIKKRFA